MKKTILPSVVQKKEYNHPPNESGITITSLAKKKKCMKSACSQLLKKLMNQQYVYKEQNKLEYREYTLFLTVKDIFNAHNQLNESTFII